MPSTRPHPSRAAIHPKVSARAAGLRYVTDEVPGISRQRAGAGFVYRDAKGGRVRDPATVARIRSLVIPPAWRHVWISPDAHGHLQVTGRDARGRKQYRYHPRWTEVRDTVKYSRMIAFARALPAIRRRVRADLKQPPLSRQRVLATVIRLLETTLIRVGNEEYAKANGSFGLTTLQDRHVKVRGRFVNFRFRAKSGVFQSIDLEDAALARSVKRCQDLPGQTLFQYLDAEGRRQSVGSRDVNAYLREISGEDFTAKEFRTWAGTVLAASALCELEVVESKAGRNRNIVQAIESVAKRLGNTRAVCRRCYVHPAVLAAYLEGTTIEVSNGKRRSLALPPMSRLSHEERAVLLLLRRLSRDTSRRQKIAA
jgi:DNA topoisomerase I